MAQMWHTLPVFVNKKALQLFGNPVNPYAARLNEPLPDRELRIPPSIKYTKYYFRLPKKGLGIKKFTS